MDRIEKLNRSLQSLILSVKAHPDYDPNGGEFYDLVNIAEKALADPPHEDKGAEEAAIQKHLISHGFNVLAKQNFINCMKEYASNERNRAIQECIDVAKRLSNQPYGFIIDELSKLKT